MSRSDLVCHLDADSCRVDPVFQDACGGGLERLPDRRNRRGVGETQHAAAAAGAAHFGSR